MAEEYTSIIFLHHARNKNRSELGIKCFKQLYETVKHLPIELIVVDNGGSIEDSLVCYFTFEPDTVLGNQVLDQTGRNDGSIHGSLELIEK